MNRPLDGDGSTENAKKLEKTAVFNRKQRFLWSEWGDSNSRHLEPKSSALPTGPHPDNYYSIRPFRNFRSNCGQISGHRTKGGSFIAQGKEDFA